MLDHDLGRWGGRKLQRKLSLGEQVLEGRICSGPMNGLGGWDRREATNTTSRNKISALLPLFSHSVSGSPHHPSFSDITGEDLVPKPEGKGAQSEQEEAAAATAAAPAATTPSPRSHPHSRWATLGGPVPQLHQPPGCLLPNACQGGVSAIAPCPALWAGGPGAQVLGMWLLVGAQEAWAEAPP